MANKSSNKSSNSVEALLGKHITISHHSLLKLNPSAQKIQHYLDAFALLLAGNESMTTHQRSYIGALCRLFCVGDASERIERLMANPQDIELDACINMLKNNESLQATWFIDAVFLASEDGEFDADAKKTLMRLTSTLDIKSIEAKKLFDRAMTLATTDDTDELVKAIGFFNVQCTTDAWKTILDYRRISFTHAFTCINNAVMDACLGDGHKIQRDIIQLQMNSLMNSMGMGEEGILMKGALLALRKYVLWDYKSLKKRVEALIETHEDAMSEGNAILSAFGYQRVSVRLTLVNTELDENVSLDNEDWHDTMEAAVNSLEQYLGEYIDVVSTLGVKLECIEGGCWTEELNEAEVEVA